MTIFFIIDSSLQVEGNSLNLHYYVVFNQRNDKVTVSLLANVHKVRLLYPTDSGVACQARTVIDTPRSQSRSSRLRNNYLQI